MIGAMVARNFYERLIDEGKLRVVEEIPRDQFMKHVMSECRAEYDLLTYLDTGFQDVLDFCPGCGNKIKR